MGHYDVNGNTMVSLLCDIYQFDGYLKSVNPPFTDDEVRRAKKPLVSHIIPSGRMGGRSTAMSSKGDSFQIRYE